MGLYESNFVRLGWLVDLDRRPSGVLHSRVPGDCELVFSVNCISPHTTMAKMTYRLAGPNPCVETGGHDSPDLELRIYHDARLVEAVAWQGEQGHTVLQRLQRRAERELDQRWARNSMLNKWLEYCSERGHRLVRAGR